MTLEKALLRAKTIGVRNFRNKISSLIKKHDMFIVTEHGSPTSVLLPYGDILEIVDILDELKDKKTIEAVASGRKSIAKGTKGILAASLFKKDKK